MLKGLTLGLFSRVEGREENSDYQKTSERKSWKAKLSIRITFIYF